MSQRGRGDPKIVRADDFICGGELGPDAGVDACDLLSDLKRSHSGKEMLDECAALRALRAVGAVNAMQELTLVWRQVRGTSSRSWSAVTDHLHRQFDVSCIHAAPGPPYRRRRT